MPKIIPIKDLRDTNTTYELVMASPDPVYVTKNGYGSFVMMSMECFEKTAALNEAYRQLFRAEGDVKAGRVSNPYDTLRELRNRYEV